MLAIDGGKPVRDTYLGYGQQWLDEEDVERVVQTLRSPMITQGPKIVEFEEKIAAYTGARYAVSFCNGTAALHAACYAAGLGEGDEVITTPITFVASANAALYVGAKPVFADIDPRTYNLSPERVEALITPRTKAIIGVDFTGQPADWRALREIADRHNLILIEDAAHALGATYHGQHVGGLADLTMFSFHPVKPITTAEGGVMITNSAEYAHRLRLFRSHGITNDRELMERDEGPWYYEMHELGMNYRLTDIQAALGISQLTKLETFLERRRKWAGLYTQAFSDMEEVITPYQLPHTESGWHLYMLRLDLERFKVGRRQMFEALRAENIGVHVHYIPVYWQPYYQRLGYQQGICPQAETWYEEVLTLPLFAKMSEDDVCSVIEAVKKVVQAYKK